MYCPSLARGILTTTRAGRLLLGPLRRHGRDLLLVTRAIPGTPVGLDDIEQERRLRALHLGEFHGLRLLRVIMLEPLRTVIDECSKRCGVLRDWGLRERDVMSGGGGL